MSSKTKIVVLRMKEIIYTAVFIGFGIFLILLLVIMFRPKKILQPPPKEPSTTPVSTRVLFTSVLRRSTSKSP